jgi:hypothetical protein
LEIEFFEDELHPLLLPLGTLNLYHDGDLGGWSYHIEEPALVLVSPIPVERVHLVRCYDLMDIVREPLSEKV